MFWNCWVDIPTSRTFFWHFIDWPNIQRLIHNEINRLFPPLCCMKTSCFKFLSDFCNWRCSYHTSAQSRGKNIDSLCFCILGYIKWSLSGRPGSSPSHHVSKWLVGTRSFGAGPVDHCDDANNPDSSWCSPQSLPLTLSIFSHQSHWIKAQSSHITVHVD